MTHSPCHVTFLSSSEDKGEGLQRVPGGSRRQRCRCSAAATAGDEGQGLCVVCVCVCVCACVGH